MKLTLLDMVQDTLSDMGSDNVTSITDTAESERVAAIFKSTYFKMVEEKNWPHIANVLQLESLSNTSLPSHMRIPANVKRIEEIKYDRRVNVADPVSMGTIELIKPSEFLERLNSRDSTATEIQVVTDPTGVNLNIRTDVAPTYCTSFDDDYLIFDSYDSTLESTLITSKTQCLGFLNSIWGTVYTAHAVSTAYAVGDILATTVGADVAYARCSVAGTTAGTIPAYSTILGATVVDGTATFIMQGTSAIDTFIPDIPSQMFPMYLAEAKTQCLNKIKQVMDSLEERDAKRLRTVMQLETHRNRQDGEQLKYGYGRK